MFRKIFDTKKTQCSSDRFKPLIHILARQDLVKVEKLFELVFGGGTESTKYSFTVVILSKEESLDDRIDKAKT